MIKRFDVNIKKYFKLFESTRTVELRKEEFISILRDNCKDFLKNPYIIQRNKEIYTTINNYSYIDPKNHIRTQKMGGDDLGVISNHALLLMDNLPSWSAFPKRANCIIGVTNERSELDFGEYTYIIIPFDNAKFGVAPYSDVWGCYVDNIKFNDGFSYELVDLGISDKSYDEMVMSMYDKFKSNDKEVDRFTYLGSIFKLIRESILDESFESFKLTLSNVLDPDNFRSKIDIGVGYKVMSYNELIKIDTHREVWTDSECLVMYIGKIDFTNTGNTHYKDLIRNTFNDFIGSL